eukprot:gene7996-21953_t
MPLPRLLLFIRFSTRIAAASVAVPPPPAGRGTLLWRFNTTNCVFGSPAVAGGAVYVGSLDPFFYALDAATGASLWRYTCGDSVRNSAAVAGNGDDHCVHAINASTGTRVWRLETGDIVYSSPAVSGGIVYFGSYDQS